MQVEPCERRDVLRQSRGCVAVRLNLEQWQECITEGSPEVPYEVHALMVAIEHDDSPTLLLGLPGELLQEQEGTCMQGAHSSASAGELESARPWTLYSQLTDLLVTTVQNIAKLHHDGVAATPDWTFVHLRQDASKLETGDCLAEIPVDVANCAASCTAEERGAGMDCNIQTVPAGHGWASSPRPQLCRLLTCDDTAVRLQACGGSIVSVSRQPGLAVARCSRWSCYSRDMDWG